MSDGMSEAYGSRTVYKKINKNVFVEIDKRRKALRITNTLDSSNEVEIKIKTLRKILAVVEEVMDDDE